MILTDYHLHTEYSWDSHLKAENLIAKAISLKYDAIAITEHLDLLPWELGENGLVSLRKYRDRLSELQASYPRLQVLGGIEIGDYQSVRDFASDLISEYDFDLILGAVHFLVDRTNVAIPLPHPLDKSQIEAYYRLNLRLVNDCDIDILAHLGVYQRYYKAVPEESFALPIIKDIFRTLIERGIALEINYSAYRKPLGCCLPNPAVLDLYREMGGRLFSIGSDSHHLDHFHDWRHLLPGWTRELVFTHKRLLALPS